MKPMRYRKTIASESYIAQRAYWLPIEMHAPRDGMPVYGYGPGINLPCFPMYWHAEHGWVRTVNSEGHFVMVNPTQWCLVVRCIL